MRVFLLTGLIFLFAAAAPLDTTFSLGTSPNNSNKPAGHDQYATSDNLETQAVLGGPRFFRGLLELYFTTIPITAPNQILASFALPVAECTDGATNITPEMADDPWIANRDVSSWTDDLGNQADAIYDDGLEMTWVVYHIGMGFRGRIPTDLIHWYKPASILDYQTDYILYCPTFLDEIGTPAVAGLAPPRV